jgi:putative nucleotidyltransferase with HDIG domain
LNSEVTNRLAQLPAFHPTALKLLTISTETGTAMEEFEDTFKSDPALASELLLTANSVEYGLRSEVESIRHALTLLGLERVSSLSFTIAMKFYMRNTPRRQVIHPVWSHSVATALIAETLGRAFRVPSRSLYTAGLVHDVGRLGLLMSEAGKYEVILTHAYESLDEASARELANLGVTHPEAGAFMAEGWGLPAGVCDCIRNHHGGTDGAPQFNQPLDLVQLACRMATALGYPEISCRRREALPEVTEKMPAPVRANPLLAPENLSAGIKQILGSVW